jgi:uncharacterized protein
MRTGVERIAHPVLWHGSYLGLPALLEREEGPSALGDFHYRVTEIHRGLSLKTDYTLPIVFYSYLLSLLQGAWPREGKVILGDGTERLFLIAPQWETVQRLLQEIEEIHGGKPAALHIGSRCRHCGWRELCLEEAHNKKDISLLFNLSEEMCQALRAQGIITYADLAAAPFERLLDLPWATKPTLKKLQIQAQALEQQEPIVLRRPRLPQTPVEIFLDMEEDAESHVNYLFGVLIRHNDAEEYKALLAKALDETAIRTLWQDFVALLASFDDFTIYHFHHHERLQFEQCATKYGIDPALYQRIIHHMVDLYPLITSSVVLPLHSYSIKSIAKYLGFQWSNVAANASQSMYWYAQWRATGNEELLEAIVQYNRDDCMATRVVKDWLTTLSQNASPA